MRYRITITSRRVWFSLAYKFEATTLDRAFDLAFGTRGYQAAARAFRIAYGTAKDWHDGRTPMSFRYLDLLIRRLEAGGIIEQEYREKIALAEAERAARIAALPQALEGLRKDREERRSWPNGRGRMKPEPNGKRPRVKVLSEPE